MNEFNNQAAYFAAVEDAAKPYVKPIVRYRPMELAKVGESVNIIPVDHPATYLNGKVAHTSACVSVGPDGSFETRNTRYVLAD